VRFPEPISLSSCQEKFIQHHDQARPEVRAGVLDAAHDFGRDHVAGHANHEQVTESGIEDEFGRHPRIAAPQDGGEWALALGETGEDDGRYFNAGRAAFCSPSTTPR
jgi:hypothetical protein